LNLNGIKEELKNFSEKRKVLGKSEKIFTIFLNNQKEKKKSNFMQNFIRKMIGAKQTKK